MCKKLKKVRQALEIAAAILGFVAAVLYIIEVRQKVKNDD